MNHRNRLIALTIVLSVFGAACGSSVGVGSTTTTTVAETTTTVPLETTTTGAEGQTFVGADGVEVTITDTSRIVSLNGDITEVIFALGLGANVVGVDVTTTYPSEAAALNDQGQTVGFAQQLTAEAVLRFEPTLVIGDQQVAPAEAIEQLRAAGVPVVILESQTTLAGVGAKISQIAEILAVPDKGQDLADAVAAEIEAATALIEGDESDPRVAYIYVRGPQAIFLFGAGMPTQAMIEGAGAIDAGMEAGVFGPAPLTPEALVAAAPDVIVLPEAGLAALGGIEALKAIPGIAETPAAQNDAFLVYDEAYFFNLGPRVGQALREFITDLYPDLAD